MTELTRAVYAIARTRRRRWLWCVWWTGAPTMQPFRAPDAWGGGASTEAEAGELAARAATRPVQFIGGPWAGAWRRLQAGLEPFPTRTIRTHTTPLPTAPHELLGVAPTATAAELKAAFRQAVLTHHPDRGGDHEMFLAVSHAYKALMRRGRSPRPR